MILQEPLIILAGPTAVGKTELSIQLAKAVDGEIISADSMQVYKGMDIGSAKIKVQEMQGVSHYMIDILEPTDAFNITMFQKLAMEYIRQIRSRGHIPIIVGGTGFYIQSVLYQIDFEDEEDSSQYQKELNDVFQEKGADFLHNALKKIDPVSAEMIHPNNIKRVMRALVYYRNTGEPISKHNEQEHQKKPAYRACYFVLNDERERLYKRIEERVDKMMADGLLAEVKALKNAGCTRDMVSMQGLGYKELMEYLNNGTTLEQAIYLIKRNTRHFAKRQLTWFRREPEVMWVPVQDFGYRQTAILDYMLAEIKKKGIL